MPNFSEVLKQLKPVPKKPTILLKDNTVEEKKQRAVSFQETSKENKENKEVKKNKTKVILKRFWLKVKNQKNKFLPAYKIMKFDETKHKDLEKKINERKNKKVMVPKYRDVDGKKVKYYSLEKPKQVRKSLKLVKLKKKQPVSQKKSAQDNASAALDTAQATLVEIANANVDIQDDLAPILKIFANSQPGYFDALRDTMFKTINVDAFANTLADSLFALQYAIDAANGALAAALQSAYEADQDSGTDGERVNEKLEIVQDQVAAAKAALGANPTANASFLSYFSDNDPANADPKNPNNESNSMLVLDDGTDPTDPNQLINSMLVLDDGTDPTDPNQSNSMLVLDDGNNLSGGCDGDVCDTYWGSDGRQYITGPSECKPLGAVGDCPWRTDTYNQDYDLTDEGTKTDPKNPNNNQADVALADASGSAGTEVDLNLTQGLPAGEGEMWLGGSSGLFGIDMSTSDSWVSTSDSTGEMLYSESTATGYTDIDWGYVEYNEFETDFMGIGGIDENWVEFNEVQDSFALEFHNTENIEMFTQEFEVTATSDYELNYELIDTTTGEGYKYDEATNY